MHAPPASGNSHLFRTNIFPGNCFTNRFISSPSSATDTAIGTLPSPGAVM